MTRHSILHRWTGLFLGLSIMGQAQIASSEESARQSWHQAIATGYSELADAAGRLDQSADRYCALPDANNRASLNVHWESAFLAWQGVRFVDFGPIEQDSRAWQLQFWPDPKNLIARKAGQLLSGTKAVTPGTIDDAGVAAQGFPMVEFLLFDQTLNQGDRALPAQQTCALLTSVTARIKSISEALQRDWQKLKPHYLDLATGQYNGTTIRAGMNALEILENRRLAGPMGLRGTGKRSIYAADAWRSGRSLAAIEATVIGLHRHFYPTLADILVSRDHVDLAGRIGRQFEKVLQRLEHLPDGMAEMLKDDSAFTRLQGLYVDISQLSQLVHGEAATALGVVRGFNSSDGD